MRIARFHLKLAAEMLAAFLALGVVGYGFSEPRSNLGHILFHLGYLLPPARPQFLSFYQWTLKTGEGGYLPASIDQFLTNRLWYCEGSKEFDAIVSFQIGQGSGRWGDAPSRADEMLKRRMIESVMRRLDTMPDDRAISALVFVESLRRGTPLSKGGFSEMYAWNVDRTELQVKRDRLVLAKRSFQNWWTGEPSWPEKLACDPLGGTELQIRGGP
jgi:hypothetical protein